MAPVGSPQFAYDIMFGPRGEAEVFPQMRSGVDGGSAEVRVPAGPRHSDQELSCSLVRQITEVSFQVETLTSRLESAGLLPTATAPSNATAAAPTVAEASGAGDANTASTFRTPKGWPWLLWAGFLTQGQGRNLLSLFALSMAVGGDAADSDAESSPQPPSSPDLDDLQAPTPRAPPAEVPEFPTLRRSHTLQARTTVPTRGEPVELHQVFDASVIPHIQRRIAAALQEVDVEGSRPFVPAGCPLVIHNPFTSLSQCELVAPVIHSPQIFREVLADFANRRGWQPIQCVQPQPDDRAVHLIPAAADDQYVSVLFRNGPDLEARCVGRMLRPAPYHVIPFRGREGRLRLPPAVARNPQGHIRLRDGDCLHADTGPFGPPPPEPARSFGCGSGVARWFILAFGASRPKVIVWGLLGVGLWSFGEAMLSAPPASLDPPSVRVPIVLGNYPWRHPADSAHLSAMSGDRPCRCSLWCPWTGPHGAFKCMPGVSLRQLQARFAPALVGTPSLCPVWPCARSDTVTYVPEFPAESSLVCVLVRHHARCKAVVLPHRMAYDDLIHAVLYQTGWGISQVRLPPGVHARRVLDAQAPIVLRNGDALDALGCRAEAHELSADDEVVLKDHCMWTRRIRMLRTFMLQLWFPHLRAPIFTWIPPGTVWQPSELTFSGGFRDRYPGRWVPIPWSPGRTVQLILASDSVLRASVLHDSADGVSGLWIARRVGVPALAHDLHSLDGHLRILGYAKSATPEPVELRDGDVLWDSFGYDPGICPWPAAPDDSGSLSMLSLLLLPGRWRFLLWVLWHCQSCHGAPVVPARRGPRSRTRSLSPPPAFNDSPRLGRWRPDLLQPFQETLSGHRHEFRVVCPCLGNSDPLHIYREFTADGMLQSVRRFAGGWAQSYVVTLPATIRAPLLVCPTFPGPFVTVVVHAAGDTCAALMPQQCTVPRVLLQCRRVTGAPGNQLHLPPALRDGREHASAVIHLRHGDQFELSRSISHPERRVSQLPCAVVPRLPHLDLWYNDFTVARSEWVFVWTEQTDAGSQCRRFRAHAGARWSASALQFIQQGSTAKSHRWIPTACMQDGHCHFVERSGPDQARVLLTYPDGSQPTRCSTLDLVAGQTASPIGWKLRDDLQARSSGGPYRDGDVFWPDPGQVTTVAVASLAASFGGAPQRLALFLSLVFGGSPTAAMWQVPEEQQAGVSIAVGKYPWRIPPPLRVCHETVATGSHARLLSPFSQGEPIPVTPDTSQEELYIGLATAEPAWSVGLMPVWPHLGANILHLVPIPGSRNLVCLVLVAAEWQCAVLVPRRADVPWLLRHLQPMLFVNLPYGRMTSGFCVISRWFSGVLTCARHKR